MDETRQNHQLKGSTCSATEFREMLREALNNSDDILPSLAACRQPAMTISSCIFEERVGKNWTISSRSIGLGATKHAIELGKLLDNEVSVWKYIVKEHEEICNGVSDDKDEKEWFAGNLSKSLKTLERLELLKSATAEIADHFADLVADKPSWHQSAGSALRAFRLAMETANPGKTYGASNPGPAVRFVQTVLHEITGIAYSLGTIAQALRRI